MIKYGTKRGLTSKVMKSYEFLCLGKFKMKELLAVRTGVYTFSTAGIKGGISLKVYFWGVYLAYRNPLTVKILGYLP